MRFLRLCKQFAQKRFSSTTTKTNVDTSVRTCYNFYIFKVRLPIEPKDSNFRRSQTTSFASDVGVIAVMLFIYSYTNSNKPVRFVFLAFIF